MSNQSDDTSIEKRQVLPAWCGESCRQTHKGRHFVLMALTTRSKFSFLIEHVRALNVRLIVSSSSLHQWKHNIWVYMLIITEDARIRFFLKRGQNSLFLYQNKHLLIIIKFHMDTETETTLTKRNLTEKKIFLILLKTFRNFLLYRVK